MTRRTTHSHFPGRTQLRRHPSPLLLAAAIGFAVPTWDAHTRNLNGGAHTVQPGDTAEAWVVRASGVLTLAPGAASLGVDLANDSQLIMQQGSSAAGRVVLGNFSELRAEGAALSAGLRLTVSTATLSNSTIENSADAIFLNSLNSASELRLQNTQAYGRDAPGGPSAGLFAAGLGLIELRDGSRLYGDSYGVQMSGRSTSQGGSEFDLLVDGSAVQSGTGPAISIEGQLDQVTANIVVRNGGELIAGNGVLLDISGAHMGTANLTVQDAALEGELRAGAGHALHLSLLDGGRYQGRMQNVASVDVAAGGHWALVEDTSVGALSLGQGGVVVMGEGAGFHALTVAGDFDGNGGTLQFRTQLEGDGAPSDLLDVRGDTRGSAFVAVQNAAGAGALTTDGIELIRVGGASDAVFTLAGRAVAGQYEYFLHKGATGASAGNWYLRSELPAPDPCLADPSLPGCGGVTPPDPCLADPALPGCLPVIPQDPCDVDPSQDACIPVPPTPVLRPEPGAYLANQSAAARMFQMRLQDRSGGALRSDEQRGAWVRIAREQARFTAGGGQLNLQGDTDAVHVGSDVLHWGPQDNARLGLMAGAGRATNRSVSVESGYAAKGKVKGSAVGVYGTWQEDPAGMTGFYVDAWANYAKFRNEVHGDALAPERYDNRAVTASLELGYGIQVVNRARSSIFIEPQLQIIHGEFKGARHVESNGTVVAGNDPGGSQARIGVRMSGHATGVSGNTVAPFLSANWIHRRASNELRFDDEALRGSVPRNSLELKLGAQLQLGRRWTAWGDMGWERGSGDYRSVAGSLGVRAGW